MEVITLGDVSQAMKVRYHVISLIRGNLNELSSKKYMKELCVPEVREIKGFGAEERLMNGCQVRQEKQVFCSVCSAVG